MELKEEDPDSSAEVVIRQVNKRLVNRRALFDWSVNQPNLRECMTVWFGWA